MAKGFQALSAILITGVMLGVVGSVYFWGLPLIEKNRDVSTLENSERFVRDLNDKIKYIANHGGRDRVQMTVPGTVIFAPPDSLFLDVETKGSIYVSGLIPLGRNSCTIQSGIWGTDEPSSICVETKQAGEKMLHRYQIRFITLDTAGIQSYRILLTGGSGTGGGQSSIVIEGSGSSTVREGLRDITNTLVLVRIE